MGIGGHDHSILFPLQGLAKHVCQMDLIEWRLAVQLMRHLTSRRHCQRLPTKLSSDSTASPEIIFDILGDSPGHRIQNAELNHQKVLQPYRSFIQDLRR